MASSDTHRSPWTLEIAARACCEAAKPLKIAAQACPEATKALKIAAQACSEATKSLNIAVQACSEATKAHQNRCSSLLQGDSGAQNGSTPQSHCSKILVSVTLCTVPLCPALLCSVHGYVRVHTSIYIYIYASGSRILGPPWYGPYPRGGGGSATLDHIYILV